MKQLSSHMYLVSIKIAVQKCEKEMEVKAV